MIRILNVYDKSHREEFFAHVPDSILRQVRNSVYYAAETNGEILTSFVRPDGSQTVCLAGIDRFLVYTEVPEEAKLAATLREADGRHCLFYYLAALGARDLTTLDDAEDDVGALEESLMTEKRPSQEGIRKLLQYKEKIQKLKRFAERMEVQTDDLAAIDSLFSPIDKRYDRIYSRVLEIQESVEHIREAYQSQIDIEQNNIMRFFTVATTVLMPLTLITGWYGMNVSMPEFHWRHGYLFVICLSICTLCFTIWLFKRKKWL